MRQRDPLPENWESHPSNLLGEAPPFGIFGPEDVASFVAASNIPISGPHLEEIYPAAAAALDRAVFMLMMMRLAPLGPRLQDVRAHASALEQACRKLIALLEKQDLLDAYDQDIGHSDQARAAIDGARAQQATAPFAIEHVKLVATAKLHAAVSAEVSDIRRTRNLVRGRKHESVCSIPFDAPPEDKLAHDLLARLWGELKEGARAARAPIDDPGPLLAELRLLEATANAQSARLARKVDKGGPRTAFDRHQFVESVCRVYSSCTGLKPGAGEGEGGGPASRFLSATCGHAASRLHPAEIDRDSALLTLLQAGATEASAATWIVQARKQLKVVWAFQ